MCQQQQIRHNNSNWKPWFRQSQQASLTVQSSGGTVPIHCKHSMYIIINIPVTHLDFITCLMTTRIELSGVLRPRQHSIGYMGDNKDKAWKKCCYNHQQLHTTQYDAQYCSCCYHVLMKQELSRVYGSLQRRSSQPISRLVQNTQTYQPDVDKTKHKNNQEQHLNICARKLLI